MASGVLGWLGLGTKEKELPPRDKRGELEEITDKVVKAYDDYNTERTSLYSRWIKALQFYRGYHWHKFSRTSGRIELSLSDQERIRLSINRTMDMVRTFSSKLMKQKPAIFTVPASGDESDYNASRAAQRFIDAIYLDKQVRVELREASVVIPLFGTGILGVEWDTIKDDFKVESITPMEFTPDWDARSLDECRFAIRTRILDKKKLEEWYGDGPINDHHAGSSSEINTLSYVMGESYHVPTSMGDRAQVRIHWYYERPSKEFPEGRRAVVADGKLYEYGAMDLLPNGDLPFIIVKDILVPDAFWGQGTAEDYVELNYAYNKTRSLMLETLYAIGLPKLIAPRGAAWANEPYYGTDPCQILEYDQGQKPEFISPPGVGGAASQEIGLLIEDMEAVSGQHETTRTSAPPGDVRAGIAIQQLLEVDEGRMGGVFASWEEGQERLAKMLLEIAKQRYAEPRAMAILGRNGSIEYADFKAADLIGNYDVRVQPGSALPQNKAARQQLVLEMRKDGLLKNDEEVLRLLDIGGMERYWDETRMDERQAEIENRMMMQGQRVAPADYQDHVRHMHIHNLRRKSAEFLTATDDVHTLFADHVNGHGQLLMLLSQAIQPRPADMPVPEAPPEGAPMEPPQ